MSGAYDSGLHSSVASNLNTMVSQIFDQHPGDQVFTGADQAGEEGQDREVHFDVFAGSSGGGPNSLRISGGMMSRGASGAFCAWGGCKGSDMGHLSVSFRAKLKAV